MKKTVYTFLSLFFALISTLAIGQIRTPQPSATASVSTTVGLTDVKVDYARPSVKGRKIYGAGPEFLVPYGEIWRTGANNGTKVTFSDDVKVAGTSVAKGEYLVLSIPAANEWTLILYSDPSIGGNMAGYDQAKDAVRVKVKPVMLNNAVETFTVNISDISADYTTANIEIAWSNVSVKLGFEVDYDEKVMKSIEANTKVNPANLMSAARYYFDTKRDLNQALIWVNEYLAVGNNSQQFWNVYFKAQVQHALGDYKGALATSQQSLDRAKAAPSDFGYVKLNEDLMAKINAEMPKTPAKKK
jgi:hypothetical protein